MASFKRLRTPSQSSSSSSGSPPQKATRSAPSTTATTHAHPLLCTLPPTCNHQPTPLSSAKDLESHYATYHAHVCEQPGCGCVFPESRLLELHQTECHDPIAAVRKDRGEKIFACHLASCPRLFQTPKTRRLHLIQAHAFPKEYFFAVTNKGVGGLLKRWGEGASMIRGEWKAREEQQEGASDSEGSASGQGEDAEMDNGDRIGGSSPHGRTQVPGREQQAVSTRPMSQNLSSKADADADALANSMTSLSLVPPSIRFGRGGKNGGFVTPGVGIGAAGNERGQGRGNNQRARGTARVHGRGRGIVRDVDHVEANGTIGERDAGMETEIPVVPLVRGRGGRLGPERGRAGIIHINSARGGAPSRVNVGVRGRGTHPRGRVGRGVAHEHGNLS